MLLTNLFGFIDEIEFTSHDEEVMQASEKARERLPDLQKQFANGLEPGYSIMLKAPFAADDGGNEWMWVEVLEWTRDSIKGILQNDPFRIASLTRGTIVDIKEEDVFDYILYLPDGTAEGDETGKVIRGDN